MGDVTRRISPLDRPAAVICDFDNTLVDSEYINTELFVRFFRDLGGIESTAEDRRFIDGAAFVDVVRRYADFYTDHLAGAGVNQLVEQFLAYKESAVSSFTVRRATGLEQLIATQLPLAIVSGSYRQEIDAVASAAGLDLDCFSPVLGSDMYSPWKPDPAGVLRAAAEIGVPPALVTVLEDSRSGLLAAQRAGMRAVHIGEFSSLTAEKATPEANQSYPTIAAFAAAISMRNNE